MRYPGAREYARTHQPNRQIHESWAATLKAINAQAREALKDLRVGDRVRYEAEEGFTLDLVVKSVTPTVISAAPIAHPNLNMWNFGGLEADVPGKLAGADLSWPCRLERAEIAR